MKKIIFFTIAIIFTLTNCSKKTADNYMTAVVEINGYACSPSCDAIAFVLNPTDRQNVSLLPTNLPEIFKVRGTVVKVYYTATGKYPAQWEGPDAEIINITSISR